jgi:hypothetical protein
MNAVDSIFQRAILKQLTEIFDGPPGKEAYLLNPGDPGLLRQLDTITAAQASVRPCPGRTTIASHVDHVHFGLTLLNRWAENERDFWTDADWEASWKRAVVTEQQWKKLRDALRQEYKKWHAAMASRSHWDETSASGALASASHTAYHLGAIRQILAALG